MIRWDYDCAAVVDGDIRCALCGGKLRPPYMMWHISSRAWCEKYFCGECCEDMGDGNGGRGGFSRDLKEMAVARRIKDLGFKPRKMARDDLFIPPGNNQH